MTSAIPNIPNSRIKNSPSVSQVRTAMPDLILVDDDTIPDELMQQLIFENIGGQELINISRNDTLSGNRIAYQPVSNAIDISRQFNSNNIIFMSDSSDAYFRNFNIDLNEVIPGEYNGLGQLVTNAYSDPNTGDLVIEFDNLTSDNQIEVEVLTSGDIFDDTIYLGESS